MGSEFPGTGNAERVRAPVLRNPNSHAGSPFPGTRTHMRVPRSQEPGTRVGLPLPGTKPETDTPTLINRCVLSDSSLEKLRKLENRLLFLKRGTHTELLRTKTIVRGLGFSGKGTPIGFRVPGNWELARAPDF
jgi:hypothetical protein